MKRVKRVKTPLLTYIRFSLACVFIREKYPFYSFWFSEATGLIQYYITDVFMNTVFMNTVLLYHSVHNNRWCFLNV